jgi:hypothetical protein
MLQLLGGGFTCESVALTQTQLENIRRLYGFTKEPPPERPPPPEPPPPETPSYSHKHDDYKRALEQHKKWRPEVVQRFMQAGADRNALRYAQEDGLRLVAWLAKHIKPGHDPMKTLIVLASEAGWDVDPAEYEWAIGDDDEEEEEEEEVEA